MPGYVLNKQAHVCAPQEEENRVFTEVKTEHRCRIQSLPPSSAYRVKGSAWPQSASCAGLTAI